MHAEDQNADESVIGKDSVINALKYFQHIWLGNGSGVRVSAKVVVNIRVTSIDIHIPCLCSIFVELLTNKFTI